MRPALLELRRLVTLRRGAFARRLTDSLLRVARRRAASEERGPARGHLPLPARRGRTLDRPACNAAPRDCAAHAHRAVPVIPLSRSTPRLRPGGTARRGFVRD